MLVLILKSIHVIGAVLFFGTGLGSAYYKYRASQSKQVAVAAWCDREVVRADWIFTVPAGATMPVTGLLLVHYYKLPLETPWVWQGLAGYVIAGLTWLPAAWLQVRMRNLSEAAAVVHGDDGRALDDDLEASRALTPRTPSPARTRDPRLRRPI
jgi:uncharacterized membrane protein